MDDTVDTKVRPSRRIPKAFQRTASPLARRIAQKTMGVGRSRKRRFAHLLPRFSRHLHRLLHGSRGMFHHLTFWIIGFVFIALCTGFLYFLFSPTFKISSMRVSREDRRMDVEEIQTLLAPNFGRHILFVSPLLLANHLESAFPEISSATIRRVFPDELHILLKMDPIVATVFLGAPDDTETNLTALASPPATTSGSLHRYVSGKGVYLEYPFEIPEGASPRLSLHFVDWAARPTHRQQLLLPILLENMRQTRAILEQSFGHSVPSVTVYLRAREFHVETVHPGRPKDRERIILWFDFSTPPLAQIEKYREFLRTVPAEELTEYVDLRLHDRVVYR